MNTLINLRLGNKLLAEIDKIVKKETYESRTELIRETLRKKVEEYRTKEALILLKENFGRGKKEGIKEPTEEEMRKIKEEVWNELYENQSSSGLKQKLPISQK
ncbi:MAG: ribbon-helix-helix domain-containing protein [Candidatus Diapherotrites archaeon]